MRVDLDEATPHISVLVLLIYKKKAKHTTKRAILYRRIFGGENKFEASQRMIVLQNDYAAAMAPLGLVRGIRKAVTHREHLTHHQYVARRKQEDAERQKAVEAAHEARATGATEKARQAALDRVRASDMLAAVQALLKDTTEVADQNQAGLDWSRQAVLRMAALLPDDYHSAGLDADLKVLSRRDEQTRRLAERIDVLLDRSRELVDLAGGGAIGQVGG